MQNSPGLHGRLVYLILNFEAYRLYFTTDQKVSLGHIRQIVGLYSSYLTFFPFSFFDDAGGGLRLKTFPLTRQLFELPYSLDDKNCLMVVSSSLSLACSLAMSTSRCSAYTLRYVLARVLKSISSWQLVKSRRRPPQMLFLFTALRKKRAIVASIISSRRLSVIYRLPC